MSSSPVSRVRIDFPSTTSHSATKDTRPSQPALMRPKSSMNAPSSSDSPQPRAIVSAQSDWTSTAIVVKKGMKIRITATGTAKLDAGGKASATPAGTTAPDAHKVMKDKPTGALIAVVGDDNTDYIFVGASVEFTAQRDGLLFLGINEGDLFDNSGSYTVHIVVTPAGRR